MSDLIDRKLAIAYAISGRVRTFPTGEDGENWIRTEEVRQSLLTMPSAQPEFAKGIDVRNKDCISRQAAIDAIAFGITYAKVIDIETGEKRELFREGNEELRKAIERVNRLPEVDAVPVEWIVEYLRTADDNADSVIAEMMRKYYEDEV